MKLGKAFFVGAILLTAPVTGFGLEDSWRGKWDGPCKGQQDFGVTITIGEGSEQFDWILHYHGQAPRSYTMKATKDKDRYVLDENNGILITNFRFGHCLLDQFSVGDTRISTRTCLEDQNNMTFEVVSSKNTPLNTTGGENVHLVKDYEVFDRYVCQLTRQ